MAETIPSRSPSGTHPTTHLTRRGVLPVLAAAPVVAGTSFTVMAESADPHPAWLAELLEIDRLDLDEDVPAELALLERSGDLLDLLMSHPPGTRAGAAAVLRAHIGFVADRQDRLALRRALGVLEAGA